MTDDDGSKQAPEAAPTGDDRDAPRSDLRARDLLSRSSEELEAIEAALDPQQLAELQSWFARPSRQVVEEEIARTKRVSLGAGLGDEYAEEMDADSAARKKRVAELATVITPEMYDCLERHERNAGRFRDLVPPAPVLDPSILAITVPTEEQIATIGEPQFYTQPHDIEKDMEDAAPQAVLRDLYRPESEFALQLVSQTDDEEQVVTDAHREVLAALAFRPERVAVLDSAAEARAAHAEFRELIAPPWPEQVAAARAVRDARRSS